MPEKLTFLGKIGYASGMFGYSILFNIISVMLIYFYVPPNNSGLTVLVPQVAVFGIFSLLSLIVASGRLFDAITDPLIAFFSDRSHHVKGRRIPFMMWSLVPSAIFCVLMFMPYRLGESNMNLSWLFLMQIGFYLSLTAYIVPYNALLPELASNGKEQVELSMWMSVAFVLGIVVASQTPLLADGFEVLGTDQRHRAIQLAIATLSGLAILLLSIPLLSVNEAKHCLAKPATIPLGSSLRQTLKNRNFRVFVMAETLYFIALMLIVSGMLYYLRVLLELEESMGGWVMGCMVVCSLFFYPAVLKYSELTGKRNLVLGSLIYLSVMMGALFYLGRLPLPPMVQIFGFAVFASIPLAVLGILPYAIIAEAAQIDSEATGQQKEGMYFAIRNMAIKFGQTIGIMIFAILTLFGKDPGDDFGIRLSGVLGFVLCILAALIFTGYRDRRNSKVSI
ncbi:MAG: MFS transporter [Saprospiraceae bacterium]|nr:MFS transporter [Saprospiraceae bacterium]